MKMFEQNQKNPKKTNIKKLNKHLIFNHELFYKTVNVNNQLYILISTQNNCFLSIFLYTNKMKKSFIPRVN